MYIRSLALSLTFLLTGATAASAQVSAPAWQRFEARLGVGLELAALPGDGFEARGTLRVADSIGSADELRAATARVLDAARELLPAPPEALVPVLERELAGMHVVRLEQRVEGLALRGARVELRLLIDGRLLMLRAQGLAPEGLASGFAVTRAEARELARVAMPDDPATLWAGAARALAVRGDDGRARAAYEVDVLDPARPEASWIATVDGASGAVIERRPGSTEALTGSVDGRGMAAGPQPAGPPVVLPMANVYVSGIDLDAALLRVTDDGCEDSQVAVSADGSRIAWVSDCGGDREIWTASTDGSGVVQLTDDPGADHSPVLSADGSLIVFVSDRDGDEELFAIDPNGAGLTQLTTNTARDHAPSLSGDGARVAYLSDADGDDELYSLLVGAPSPVQLTFDALDDEQPSLSLDGSRIAWISRADGDAEVYTIAPDGSEHAQVTVNGVDERDPAISPDGTEVAFASSLVSGGPAPDDPSGGGGGGFRARKLVQLPSGLDLFLAARDGSTLERLTHAGPDERAPAWSADGAGLAYVSGLGAASEVELLDLATGELVRLTDDAAPDGGPRPGAVLGAGAWIADDGDGEVWVWDLTDPLVADTTTTDSAGLYSLDVPDGSSPSVSARLRGRWARVYDLDPRWGSERDSGTFPAPGAGADLHFNEFGAEEGPTAQVTAYRHTDRAHDVLAGIMRRPPLSQMGVLEIDEQLDVRANFPRPVPNAFYSLIEQHTTFFVGAGPMRPNTAYDTLVSHETVHFYDDLLGGLGMGSPCEAAGANGEGTADAGAMVLSGSAVVGADFWGPGVHVRDYGSFPWASPVDPVHGLPTGAKGRQFDCLDCPPVAGQPEIHVHGQAIAGFFWFLRGLVGAVTAEDILAGVMLAEPQNMLEAVTEAFLLTATPAFGGTGDPATSPLYGPLCKSAAAHGFDCPDRFDFGSLGCSFPICGAAAVHRIIGTEWLGAIVATEGACEPYPSPEEDGVDMPAALWMGGTPIELTFGLSVDPALKGSGRYGAPLPHPQLPERRVYLNAWLLIDDTEGGFLVHKVLGSGSGSGIVGPDTVEPGLDAVAFNPDTWPGTTAIFSATITPPTFGEPRPAILRVRLDHGEDSGRLGGCLSSPALMQHCGPARFGEVEDYQVMIVP